MFSKGSNEIIGVVSLSAMDHDERTRGPSVMARIDAYRSVFNHAKLIADGMHPNVHPRGGAVLTAEGLACGYNVRNAVTLEGLARVIAVLVEDGAIDPG